MKTITTILILIFAVLIVAQTSNAQTKRLQFRKGASSATVKGVVQCDRVGDALYWLVGARKGQKLTALMSGADAKIIDRNGIETEFTNGQLEYVYSYSGDAKIYVYFTCSGSMENIIKYGAPKARYTLKVSIRQ